MTTRTISALTLCGLLSLLGTTAFANPKTGTLSGQVRDTRGKPITDAQVMILGTGEVAETDGSGSYTFVGEDPSTVTVRASADKFKMEAIKTIIRPGEIEKLDFILEAGITHRTVVAKHGRNPTIIWDSGPRTRQVYADPQESFPGDLGLHSTARSR